MKLLSRLLLIAALAVALAPQALLAQSTSLPRSTPEAQGVASGHIRALIEAVDRDVNSMHSFMLVRRGHVIAEAWWKPAASDKPHVLWSLSKSFTSTAVGMAVAEGKLDIHDRVLEFFPDDAPEKPTWQLAAMRVSDLLTMSVGHEAEVNLRGKKNWIGAFLAHKVPHKPGTHFKYNTPASFMLSAIVQEVTGETLLNYLTPRLFKPLGIKKPRWDAGPEGRSIGGYGLFLRTEDIAKFGQLYLQRGVWDGEQLLPAAWVAQATSKQTSNGSDPKNFWDQGYGYQFWMCRDGAFRGDGMAGQFCIVFPAQEAVVVMTAKSDNMKTQLDLIWHHLLPAFREGSLAESPEELEKLKAVVSGLKARR